MAATHLIAARVTEETKSRFRTLAKRQHLTESVLLKQLMAAALHGVEIQHDASPVIARPKRMNRICVRIVAEDLRLLKERAHSRQMPCATYVSVLIRSHLRDLSPLPKAELMALKRSVAELNAIGRNVNQLTLAAHQSREAVALSAEHVRQILILCESMRGEIKRLIIANAASWSSGHA